MVSGSGVITSDSWVKRSTPWQAPSVTRPTGEPPSTTTTMPCARLPISEIASATVELRPSVIAVS
jgi:hypothetical protein